MGGFYDIFAILHCKGHFDQVVYNLKTTETFRIFKGQKLLKPWHTKGNNYVWPYTSRHLCPLF